MPAARSLKTAPLSDRSAPITPSPLSTSGFKPTMVPSSVENRTLAGALLPSWLMTKSDVVLATLPLGAATVPGGSSEGVGTMTGFPWRTPWASSNGAWPAPLAETRNWPSGVSEKPHGLRRFGSVWAVRPAMLDARPVCT